MLERARVHLKFCMKLCKLQMEMGLHFLFEHPWSAASWNTEEVVDVSRRKGVQTVRGDMCRFGMMSEDEEGKGLVKVHRIHDQQ